MCCSTVAISSRVAAISRIIMSAGRLADTPSRSPCVFRLMRRQFETSHPKNQLFLPGFVPQDKRWWQDSNLHALVHTDSQPSLVVDRILPAFRSAWSRRSTIRHAGADVLNFCTVFFSISARRSLSALTSGSAFSAENGIGAVVSDWASCAPIRFRMSLSSWSYLFIPVTTIMRVA